MESMQPAPGSPWRRSLAGYLVAAAGVLLATWVRVSFVNWINPLWLLFYPAVLAAALAGGLGPGLVATALSGLVTVFWILPAEHQTGTLDSRQEISLALSAAVGVILSVVADGFRRSRRAEAALRRSQAQLALFVRHAPASIAMFDGGMRYLAVSDRFLTDYRLAGREVLGRSHYEIFPEIPERWREIHRRCLAGAVERCEADPFPRADGRTDWIRWEIRPWLDEAGRIGGLLLFSEVITGLREAERQAARAERLEAVGRLVRGMSHEVNNPLAGVIANLGFARDGLAAAPPPARRAWEAAGAPPVAGLEEALADAAEAADRVKGIMRDLAGFLPHPGAASTRTDLAVAARKALRLAHHELVPCAEVRTDLDGSGEVGMPEDDLVQVLAALLVNAGQATGDRPNVVTVSARPLGDAALAVEVADTGTGMDEATLGRLFEPFFTTRQVGRGKGLGLPRCRTLAEGAGGELSVRSEAGRGTTARLVLPLAPPAG